MPERARQVSSEPGGSQAERGRVRRAELLSTTGAGLIGAGLALLLQRWTSQLMLPILAAGIVVHAVGMGFRHRFESRAGAGRAGWEEPLYWACWIALAPLAVWAALRE